MEPQAELSEGGVVPLLLLELLEELLLDDEEELLSPPLLPLPQLARLTVNRSAVAIAMKIERIVFCIGFN